MGAAVEYAGWLAGPAVERGLLGPREADRLWERHLLNSAALAGPLAAELPLGRGGRVCDLGSGAGLPGIVVALLRPDLEVVLVEPLLRRARFLDEVVAALDLPRTTVVRARAEDTSGPFDVVVARAVAPLDRLARWALPLLGPGGALLALKGERASAELTASAQVLDRLGAGAREALPITLAGEQTTVVTVVAGAATPAATGTAT
jgi:16S rRNA (guanine527-N7)-methyltransferase